MFTSIKQSNYYKTMGDSKEKKENQDKQEENKEKPTIEIDLAEEKPKKDFIKVREPKKEQK